MGFHSSARHLELTRDFGVIAALQEQFHDLLLAGTKPDSGFRHPFLLVLQFVSSTTAHLDVAQTLSTQHAIFRLDML